MWYPHSAELSVAQLRRIITNFEAIRLGESLIDKEVDWAESRIN